MKPTVTEVLPLIQEYLAVNLAGGSLHIVLDDYNVSDEDVSFCLQYAKEQGDDDGVAIAEILMKMSETQRLKLAKRGHYG